ncbi:hypothetical protein ABIA33_007659 [Streptacidiphilus sp. MAP12-16]
MLTDPEHASTKNAWEWLGFNTATEFDPAAFDPAAFDLAKTNAALSELATIVVKS